MGKIIDGLKDLYNSFISFYASLNEFGLYMFYGVVTCLVLIIIVLLFIRRSKTKKDYKVVIESPKQEVIEEKVEELVPEEPIETIQNEDKLNDILKMRDRLDEALTDKKVDAVEAFEMDQEQTAVISYDELKKVADRMEDTGKIPVIPYPEVKDKRVEEKDLAFTANYKRSDFISPIHGIQKKYDPKHVEKKMELEKTINIEPLNNEIKNSVEFLESLKDLRKNLN